MITNIHLENFKCFRELDLDCAPLTLLTGINGTGKSSVFQALLLLRQTKDMLGHSLGTRSLALNGPYLNLGSPKDILFEGANHIKYDCSRDDSGLFNPLLFQLSPSGDELNPIDIEGYYDYSWSDLLWESDHPLMHTPLASGKLGYVSAERTGPRNMYSAPTDYARYDDLGYGGELAWNYLYNNQSLSLEENDPRALGIGTPRLIDVVNQWLQGICPGARIELEHLEVANTIVAKYAFDRPGGLATGSYRPANVGFGLSYTLPVIVALLMPKDSFCMIENPEAHLHPSGQTKLGELAARAAKSGVQVFIETHSDHFIDGVRIAVREGVLEPDDVAINYFERQGNESVVKSPVIDSDGRLSEWPAGFFDQHEMNLIRLLR